MGSIDQQINAAAEAMKAADISLPDGMLDALGLLEKAEDNLEVAHRDVFDAKFKRVDVEPDIPRARRCLLRSMVYSALALSLLPDRNPGQGGAG